LLRSSEAPSAVDHQNVATQVMRLSPISIELLSLSIRDSLATFDIPARE
jgi:hypothetical protein